MMNRIRVLTHGLHREEVEGKVITRPQGMACFTLMRFHSPMHILTAQGKMTAKSGSCIIIAPEYPHHYSGAAGPWINDWMHFGGEGAAHCIRKYAIPLNTVFVPDRTDFLPMTFHEIAYEERHQRAGWEDVVEALMSRLLALLGRECKESAVSLSPIEAGHLATLRVLRQHLAEQLAKPWTIKEMASEVGLSPARFCVLYQQFFEVSPIEDLLRMRIRHAQFLLTDQAILVSEVAHQCGFRNANYFSTLFHRRVGCAPRDYYQYTLSSAHSSRPLRVGLDE